MTGNEWETQKILAILIQPPILSILFIHAKTSS